MTLGKDWRWADRYLPQVKQIVGQYLLEAAPLEVDRNEATDLTVLKAKNTSIACRIRRGTFQTNYVDQFTIRSKRQSGKPTEFEKIAQGHCGLMFYGFAADGETTDLMAWNLIDLDSFRYHLIMSSNAIRSGEKSTADGTMFRWYDLRSFPQTPPILIASSSKVTHPGFEAFSNKRDIEGKNLESIFNGDKRNLCSRPGEPSMIDAPALQARSAINPMQREKLKGI